jgi:hypothetical protein
VGWMLSGTIRVIDWSSNPGFICAANLVTSFWTHVHIIFNILPHFLSAGTGGTNRAEIATPNVSWIGRVGPIPHINKARPPLAAVVVRHLRPLSYGTTHF